jgi:hypothetical protein
MLCVGSPPPKKTYLNISYVNYVNSSLIGQPKKAERLLLPDQSVERNCIEYFTLENETRRRAEWAQKFRQDEKGNW